MSRRSYTTLFWCVNCFIKEIAHCNKQHERNTEWTQATDKGSVRRVVPHHSNSHAMESRRAKCGTIVPMRHELDARPRKKWLH